MTPSCKISYVVDGDFFVELLSESKTRPSAKMFYFRNGLKASYATMETPDIWPVYVDYDEDGRILSVIYPGKSYPSDERQERRLKKRISVKLWNRLIEDEIAECKFFKMPWK